MTRSQAASRPMMSAPRLLPSSINSRPAWRRSRLAGRRAAGRAPGCVPSCVASSVSCQMTSYNVTSSDLPLMVNVPSRRTRSRNAGQSRRAVASVVITCAAFAMPRARAARFTESPNRSPAFSSTGPKWQPMRTASLGEVRDARCAVHACISQAVSSAASALGKTHISSSPMRWTTRPEASPTRRAKASRQPRTRRAARSSPSVS